MSWCLILIIICFSDFLMSGVFSDHVLSKEYLRTVLFYDAMLRLISRAYDAVYPSNSSKAPCMSGPAKASS